jgi:hypothetical protein
MGTRARVTLGIGCAIGALAAVGGVAYARAQTDHHPDTVIVPGIRSGGLQFAFDQLRGSGLRVAIPSTIPFRETSSPSVRDQTPRGGTRVKWGSVVTLTIDGGQTGSPSGPTKLPVYRVPDFTGKSLEDVVTWTRGKAIYWKSDLPPLPPSSAKHLFDAYVITEQHPPPGSEVKLWAQVRMPNLGVGVRLTPVVLEVEPR